MTKVTMKQYEMELRDYAKTLEEKARLLEQLEAKAKMAVEMAKLVVQRFGGDGDNGGRRKTPPTPPKPSGTDNAVTNLKKLIEA